MTLRTTMAAVLSTGALVLGGVAFSHATPVAANETSHGSTATLDHDCSSDRERIAELNVTLTVSQGDLSTDAAALEAAQAQSARDTSAHTAAEARLAASTATDNAAGAVEIADAAAAGAALATLTPRTPPTPPHWSPSPMHSPRTRPRPRCPTRTARTTPPPWRLLRLR